MLYCINSYYHNIITSTAAALMRVLSCQARGRQDKTTGTDQMQPLKDQQQFRKVVFAIWNQPMRPPRRITTIQVLHSVI
jgi:hypothetical protein